MMYFSMNNVSCVLFFMVSQLRVRGREKKKDVPSLSLFQRAMDDGEANCSMPHTCRYDKFKR